MHRLLLLLVLGLAGCATAVAPPSGAPRTAPGLSPEQAAQSFLEVVATVEPVAERECRRLTSGVNCDFLIRVDRDIGAEPNAFQSLTRDGRPVITFTVAMIAEAMNADEMAFVLGHETSHHILGHLARQARNAAAGAAIFAELATLSGGGPAEIASAQNIGAEIGALSYSKEFELEADRLGTLITLRAGYDPIRGAGYFARSPDPGDRFLGTHPPNAARLAVVRDTARRLGVPG